MNTRVRTSTHVLPDLFAEQVLGYPVFELTVDGLTATTIQATIQEVQEEMRGRRAVVYSKVRVADTSVSLQLAAASWYLVDTNVQLEKLTSLLYPKEPKGVTFRFAQGVDEEAVAAIARASFTASRWHRDAAIPLPLADALKEQWARNFWRGQRGDYMIVAEAGGQVAGFHQVVREHDDALLVDLIAVAKDFRGRSIGTGLLNYASQYCGRVSRMRVGTQVTNRASLALYQKNGFSTVSARHIWHKHLPGEVAHDRLTTDENR